MRKHKFSFRVSFLIDVEVEDDGDGKPADWKATHHAALNIPMEARNIKIDSVRHQDLGPVEKKEPAQEVAQQEIPVPEY